MIPSCIICKKQINRSNVAIISQWDGATVLYSHWGGQAFSSRSKKSCLTTKLVIGGPMRPIYDESSFSTS